MFFLRNVLLLVSVFTITSSTRSVLDVIREDELFSSFRSLLYRYDGISLLQGNISVFVPTNTAFQNFRGVLDEKILLNHIVNWTVLLEDLDSRTEIVTQECYPRLRITRGLDFIYVNNAKIDLEHSIYTGETIQKLYVVDEVLAPVIITTYNKPAKAIDFIESRLYDFSHFYSAILDIGGSTLYNKSTRNTYFVPLNTRFSGLSKRQIDLSVLKGHIVPFHALFTRPSSFNFPFPTIYQSSLNVVLRFLLKDDKILVESETYRNSTSTTTTAEIIEANIPVDNGVIHVINTTLVISTLPTDIFPYLSMFYKISGDPTLNFSYTLTSNASYDGVLKEDVQMTFFVPRDEAWLMYSEQGKRALQYCARIFFRKQMIIGETAYTMKDLELLSQSSEVALNSLGGMISLKVKKVEDNYYLVWKNKTIRVHRGDYACTNGFVHIVDEPFLSQCDLISCRKQYAAHLRKVARKW